MLNQIFSKNNDYKLKSFLLEKIFEYKNQIKQIYENFLTILC